MTQNPLLDLSGLPPFSQILPEQVEPAIDALLADCRQGVEQALKQREFNWDNLIEPLELLDNRLNRAWAAVGHLNSVADTPELRAAHDACLPKLAEYGTEMGQNEALFAAYQGVAKSAEPLNQAQRKTLDNALRDFHLSGVDLPAQQKARFKAISQELSQLTSQFDHNLLDATQAWSKGFDSIEPLAGLPQSALDQAAQAARQHERQGWLINLEFPSYFAVMTYADDRALRREVYEAYATRASELGPQAGQWDNSGLMEQILALRHEAAQLLGFANYAEKSLATKMAPSTDAVVDFLQDLAARSRPQAERELAQLSAFAREEHGLDALQAWDIGYYSEKLRQRRHRLSQEELRPYFPAPKVIAGLFELVQRLFGVHISAKSGVDTWHKDVGFYQIHNPEGELIAQFYLDPYARPHKRGGAWMDDCAGRFFGRQIRQIPVAFLTCNFTPPLAGEDGDKPALLTHDEVQTLFHEFGHGLHHMLTRIDCPAVSGISGVEWDAVELPSQFLENFCWERQVLDLISGHVDTGEPIPDELYRRMLEAKNFQSAMQMVRQLEFALFDFRIHREYDPSRGGRIYEILAEVRQQVSVVRPPEWNRFAHGFSHIFSGGYGAGYYSYKWAEVLSADAFGLFEERGVMDPATGQAFLQQILQQGGSRPAMELFRAFRGREPDIAPLLRHSGIAAAKAA
ncbi:MAG: oligopeptidase A [Gammaproteobacteria bacterium]|nr:oligopeptidase A [Gammaproteobacteria bacterium]